MRQRNEAFHAVCVLFALALAAAGRPAQAQLNGHNLRGDFGLESASQPSPRLYVAPLYANYSTSTIRDRDGNELPTSGSLHVNAVVPLLWYVTDLKILGANYGIMAAIPLQTNALEAPALGIDVTNKFGVGDLYVQPVNLGWHFPQVDVMVGIGAYAPTGRFSVGADDNTGLGMWSFEGSGGATVFFDRERTWSFSALGFYETHTKKKDTDVKVGDIVTVEGGAAKSFLGGGAKIGAVYVAQWKITQDDLGVDLPAGLSKSANYGVGPEVTLPIPVKRKLVGLVTLKYLWELGTRSTTQGRTFLGILTVPIPSIAVE
jgi:hypothetical protein